MQSKGKDDVSNVYKMDSVVVPDYYISHTYSKNGDVGRLFLFQLKVSCITLFSFYLVVLKKKTMKV